MSKLLTLNFTILLYLVLFSSCATVSSQVEPPLQVVSRVDINKYLGRWYEIGRYPNWFQENCYSVTADYELSSDGFIKVINRCKDRELNGEIREAMGIAYISDTKTNAKLKVSFHWPFYGDYWIIDLDDDYEYVVVSEPKRQYLWILSRTPTMDTSKYNEVIKSLEKKSFDMSIFSETPLE
jgi:apolipoprotein D and lipocalin family protein